MDETDSDNEALEATTMVPYGKGQDLTHDVLLWLRHLDDIDAVGH